MKQLSHDLTFSYGKGFGLSNLKYIRKFYLTFQKSGTPSHLLCWGHYYEILKIDDELERNFYIHQCELERWNVRELKRQMRSMLFHRIALSKDKEGVLELAKEGISNQLFAGKYQLFLPKREELQKHLDMLLEEAERNNHES